MYKIVFSFFVFLSIYISGQEIPLVWQFDRARLRWEEDWVRDILEGIEFVDVEDGHYEKFIDNSIVIFSSYHNTDGVSEYFKEMRKRGHTFGVINLSDERELGPLDFYPNAAFVFRNYWRPDFIDQENVVIFPLGYGPDFWKEGKKTPRRASERESIHGVLQAWCAIVQLEKRWLRI